MAVKLRLKRMGAKKASFYRIVTLIPVSRDGRSIETIGYYNPTTTPATVKIDADLAMKWLRNGAQNPSDTVRNLLSGEGLMKRLHEEKREVKYGRTRSGESFTESGQADGGRPGQCFSEVVAKS